MCLYNSLKTIRIREVVIIHIISALICLIGAKTAIVYFNAYINDTFINYVILSYQIIVLVILLFKLNISLEKVKILISDSKQKVDIYELLKIVFVYYSFAIGGICVVICFAYLISPSVAYSIIMQAPIVVNNYIDYIINVIYLVIVVPINEELIFRHILFRRLSKKFSAFSSIIVVSILFASINAGVGILGAFLLSIMNCIIYIKYRNITVPILNKIVINIISAIIFVPIINYCKNFNVFRKEIILQNALIGFCMMCIGMFFFIKFIKKNNGYVKSV